MLFLTGHRKSGTTLLHSLFDGHPDLSVYPIDVCLLYAYFPCHTQQAGMDDRALEARIMDVLGTVLERVAVRDGVESESLDPKRFLQVFGRHLDNRDLRCRTSVISALRDAWREYTKAGVDRRFVLKETSQVIHFPEFSNAFKDCQFVNIIRDPRDNYAALKAGVDSHYASLGEGDLETLASLINRARMDLRTAQLYRDAAPDRMYVVKYEDLVTDPHNEMRLLAAFADIDFKPGLLEPTILGTPFDGNSFDSGVFSGVSQQNIGSWRRRISESEAKIIEFWMRDVMDYWGYERVFSEEEAVRAVAPFYDWYNCKYFYHDSFASRIGNE